MEELEKNSTSSLKHALQELQNELEETHNTKLKRLTDEVDTLRAENKRRVDDCASLQDELQKATTALGVKDISFFIKASADSIYMNLNNMLRYARRSSTAYIRFKK